MQFEEMQRDLAQSGFSRSHAAANAAQGGTEQHKEEIPK
jgi:hypothetical protein